MRYKTITVVATELADDAPPWPLVYIVKVRDPSDMEEVRAAVERERERDLGFAVDMEPLFAFAGNVPFCEDWRD
jgi:hypothetical protein